MPITWKLTITLTVVTSLILGVLGALTLRREIGQFDQSLTRNTELIARTVAASIEEVWRVSGEERAMEVLAFTETEEEDVGVRWVWLEPRSTDRLPRAGGEDLAPALDGREVVVRLPGDGTGGLLIAYVPVRLADGRLGAIEAYDSLAPREEYTRASILGTVGAIGVTLLLSALVAFLAGSRLVARPVQVLIDKARRVGAGDFGGRTLEERSDEFGLLAEEMDGMCTQLAQARDALSAEMGRRIEALEHLRHAERLATVGKLASGVAHELGTPLNVIAGRAGWLASSQEAPESVRREGRQIREQADRVSRIIRQLLDFARRRQPAPHRQDLRRLVGASLDLLRRHASSGGVALRTMGDPGPVVASVDGGQLQQVLTNLVLNAIQATPSGGEVRVELGRVKRDAPVGAATVWIAVEDDGPGVAPEALPHVFEPFFTTKPSGEGTGLGLSVAHGIIDEHGGRIEITEGEVRGARFIVHLPVESGR